MSQDDLQRMLEIMNGNWGIEAAILAFVAGVYLDRSAKFLRFTWRNWLFNMPRGMQVALAIAGISGGVAITRITIWSWRVFYDAGDFTAGLLVSMIVGTFIGAMGFLWAIIEIGIPLFGNGPWIVTLMLMAIFTLVSLFFR